MWIRVLYSALYCVALIGSGAAEMKVMTGDEVVVDRNGLAFVNNDAFCRFHCKTTHLYRRRGLQEASECTIARGCSAYMTQYKRQLREQDGGNNTISGSNDSQVDNTVGAVTASNLGGQDNDGSDTDVEVINFVTCQGVAQGEIALNFEFRTDQNETSVFQGFQSAFFAAFDAMILNANSTYDACQLEFLQQKFLPTVNETSANANSSVGRKPMLIKLLPDPVDQRDCVRQVKTIWTRDDEGLTPFLSRQDQSTAVATILLMHIDSDVAERINDLECVDSVLALPAILKLMPFARSASQLSMRSTTELPALEIRLVNGSNQQEALERLQTNFKAINGVLNVFELPENVVNRPLSIYSKPLDEMETWSHMVALALSDSLVEWIDLKSDISQNSLRNSIYSTKTGIQMDSGRRRLDEYVQGLMGIEPAKAAGIKGNDIIVGITDSGLYIDHDQFDQESRSIYSSADMSARKVVYYNAWANRVDESDTVTCGHGTHVSGILAGSSYSGTNTDLGIADNAKIAFMDIGLQSSTCAGEASCAVQLATPADASDLLKSQIDVGAKIFSFSWGTPGSDYSSQARDLDAFIYDNPDVLLVVAAGNSGEQSANGRGTISSPSGAKNVISVGASLNSADSFTDISCPDIFNEYSVASFSSAGPTTDGRMKPDVVAPGMTIVSSQSLQPGSTTKTSATCSLQGTSQATPVVTGIAVLLYEWLRDGWWKNGVKDATYGMSSIPAALLKALIIHSGESLKKRIAPLESGLVSCAGIKISAWNVAFPDIYQGYGKPNMSNIADFTSRNSTPSLYFLPNSTEGSEPRVGHQQEVVISFTVSRNVDLRATLVWTDPAGSITSSTQLQHDLDLTIRLQNGLSTFYPLTADSTTKRDEKNNVEMVQVSYQELLDAANNETNGTTMIGSDGEIVVEAVIYGHSVLLADYQTFAFVASSSVIGTTTGSGTSSSSSDSFWKPWSIAAVGAGALVLLLLIATIVRCCTRRKIRHRHGPYTAGYPAGAPVVAARPGQTYYSNATPAGGSDRCPFCLFTTPDPVVMVNHVENMHNNGNSGEVSGNMPQHPQHAPRYDGWRSGDENVAIEEQRCPSCNFVTPDAVILVNHVEHVHRQGIV